MIFSKMRCVVFALVLSSLISGNEILAQEWPAFRGPDGTGHLETNGILSRSRKIGLKIRWKRKLGSGYSSVIVSQGKLLAMYCDETSDRVGCFDQADGGTIWSVPIGSRFKGENGSFDGPISTPVVRGGNVYCLSPRGKFLCLKLENGEEVWSRDLVKQNDAVRPLYGFATSPIVVGEKLIVQSGGAEKSLTGLDAESGATKWACTNDSIDSQSPALITIDGKQIVLAAGGKKLIGVDPGDGAVLFEHLHGGGNGSAVVPVVFDKNKVLMTLDDGFSTAVSIRKAGDTFQVSELWKQNSIKNTYNVPVIHEGHFYAYSTRIMTCVDAETGRAKWKSRAPGDGFLIVVDGHVILNTKKGSLHVLRATPETYEEIAGAEIFDDLVWSLPAFSQDAVFMRSLGELACIELVGEADIAKATTDALLGKQFAAMLSEASGSDEPQEIVDAYLASNRSFPVIEGNLAHFIYQGQAKDVAVAGDMFGARQERKMQQISGTNTWFQVTELPDDVRLNYVFLVDFKPQTDSRNKRTTTSSIYAGEMEFAVRLRNEAPLEMSWFGMPNWKEPLFTSPVATLRGELVKKSVPSKLLEESHAIEVYVPPRETPVEENSAKPRYPVVYVFDGANAKLRGKLHEVADNLCSLEGAATRPIVVFIDGSPGPKFLKSVADEIVPFVDQEFSTVADRTSRICLSNGLLAPMSLQLIGEHSDVFGAASVQTPLIFDEDQESAIEAIKNIQLPTHIFFEWGEFDMFNPDENWDARKIGKRLFDEFAKSKNITMHGGEAADSTDWSSWRNRFAEIVSVFESMPGTKSD